MKPNPSMSAKVVYGFIIGTFIQSGSFEYADDVGTKPRLCRQGKAPNMFNGSALVGQKTPQLGIVRHRSYLAKCTSAFRKLFINAQTFVKYRSIG